MVFEPCPFPESLFNSLTQGVYELMKKARNRPFCIWSGRHYCTTEQGIGTRL